MSALDNEDTDEPTDAKVSSLRAALTAMTKRAENLTWLREKDFSAHRDQLDLLELQRDAAIARTKVLEDAVVAHCAAQDTASRERDEALEMLDAIARALHVEGAFTTSPLEDGVSLAVVAERVYRGRKEAEALLVRIERDLDALLRARGFK